MTSDPIWRFAAALSIPLLVFSGCGAAASHAVPSTGSVTGEMIMEGGTSRDFGPRPIPGTVEFDVGGRRVATVTVGVSGRFSTPLAAGTYSVRACTSRIQAVSAAGVGSDSCGSPVEVRVRAGAMTPVTLVSIVP